MFRGRLQTANVSQKTMEIKKIIFTCPDLKKGMFVSCTHIIFVFLLVIEIVDETVSNTLHISDKE